MWNNSFTKNLGIEYPIIQAPMLGVSTPEMAAAASNQGSLGSLAIGGLSPEATIDLVRKTKKLTSKPFAVNLFAHSVPGYSISDIKPMQDFLLYLAHKRGYALKESDLYNFKFYTWQDQVDALIQENISIISFTFGCLDNETIKQLQDRNCVLIGTATSTDEALYLQKHNIDMICVQGIEAGGHRGTFLTHDPLPQVGLFSLLPQIAASTSLPCIAAGGIHNVQSMRAAFDLGAVAVQIGTAFIGTEESIAIYSYKQRLETAKDTDSSITRAFSGRWARGLRNEMMREIENSGIAIPPYPIMNSLTATFRKLAQQNNDDDYTNLWAGQSPKPSAKHTGTVLINLIKEYENLYK
ncbi:MAG TPA: nitronate monooxygenase [Bacteroidia bacterium]